jgi:hypothetical protein
MIPALLIALTASGVLDRAGVASAQTLQERLQLLAPLVGTWDTEDTYRPDSAKPAVERGVRRCAFAVADRYVECITRGTNAAGRTREYRFYLTWDPDRGRYTMLSFWSNVGNMSLTTFTIDSTGKVWDIRGTAPYVENGVESRTWSTLTIVAPDAIEWVGRINRSTDAPTSWPVTFRETWKRRMVSRH